MNNWKSGVMKLFFALTFVVSFFAVQTSAFAATVGSSQLKTPEESWQRIIDSNPLITYEGSWILYKDSSYSTGSAHATTLNGSKASFWFEGTKLRIIGSRNINKSTVMKIQIDESTFTFSGLGAPQSDTLLFEKTDLADTGHQVTITYVKNTSTDFVLSAIDIDSSGSLIAAPDAVTNLTASPNIEGKQIELNWNSVTDVTYYVLSRAESSGGPYTIIATDLTSPSYEDEDFSVGVTYYYVVTAINDAGESGYSNEASATVEVITEPDPEPSGDQAILTIYLTNGTEKEYDLSMDEVNSFIEWYDAKDTGTGPAKYKFVKRWNKGPFSKRTEYVIFDKILTFNVDEYSNEE